MMPAVRIAARSRPSVSVVAGRMGKRYRRMLTGTVTPPGWSLSESGRNTT